MQNFKNCSIRARVAFILICIEEYIISKQLSIEEYSYILAKFWEFTHCKGIDEWGDQIVEILPSNILIDKYNSNNYEYLKEEDYWKIKSEYVNIPDILIKMFDLAFQVATIEIYSSIKDNSYRTLDYLNEFLILIQKENVKIPSIDLCNKYPINEGNGWGKIFYRDDILNDLN